MRLIAKLLGVDKPLTTIEASDDTFDELRSSRRVVIVDFWATWCGPCRRFSPVFERVATQLKHLEDLRFVAVDVDACPKAAAALQISSVPSVVAFVDGAPVTRTGPSSAAQLTDFVERHRGMAGLT
ncbi:MAG: thioredoxin domain-containing protein [Bowdeniella nasicola]|nr:thioredoxin domain-containing protein [Bowdeniella nasicola]